MENKEYLRFRYKHPLQFTRFGPKLLITFLPTSLIVIREVYPFSYNADEKMHRRELIMFTIYGILIRQCPFCKEFIKADQINCCQCGKVVQQPPASPKKLKPPLSFETKTSTSSKHSHNFKLR